MGRGDVCLLMRMTGVRHPATVMPSAGQLDSQPTRPFAAKHREETVPERDGFSGVPTEAQFPGLDRRFSTPFAQDRIFRCGYGPPFVHALVTLFVSRMMASPA